ncbi:MAG TPA: hypothetical protein VJ851_03250 [Jatrophihabitans sp.]|nr:hypothetical protein [Jatrophihabitans sp.]
MRTENDLRVALYHRADQAPDAAQALIVRALADQHRPSVTRARLSMAMAVALVAALIAVPLAVRHLTASSNGTRPASSQPKQIPALSWVTATNDDYRIGRTLTVGSKVEILDIQTPDFSEWALADFAPGTFDTSLVARATPIVVDGHPGYFAKASGAPHAASYLPELLSPLVNGSFAHGHGYFSTVAWQIAPEHWVMLDRYAVPSPRRDASASQPELLAFAATLHLKVRTDPVRQVFRVGYLPGTGWQLKSLTISDLGDLPLDSLREAVLVDGNRTVQISVARHYPGFQYPDPHRLVGDYVIEVNRDRLHDSALDATTTRRILDSITLAAHPVHEDGSWFPVSSMLP